MDYLENLLAKGVTWGTPPRILWTLLPQALGLTIPMAVLVGGLIGLGRMSSDREAVALLACGVSPYRLLRPIVTLALITTAVTTYVMIVAIPNANQTFREITFAVVTQTVETDIRPRVFYQQFPGWVLYPREEPDPGQPGWKKLMVAANRGRRDHHLFCRARPPLVNRAKRAVDLVLTDGYIYKTGKGDTAATRFPAELVLGLNPNDVFPKVNLQPGLNEKTIAQLPRGCGRQAGQGHVGAPRSHRHPAEVLVPGGMPGVRDHRPGARAHGRPRRQARQLRRRRPRDLRLLHRHVPVGVADQGAIPEHVFVALDAQYPARGIRRRRP